MRQASVEPFKRVFVWLYVRGRYVHGDGLKYVLDHLFSKTNYTICCTWWRHRMETLSTLLALCAGNHRSPVNSSHKGQWRGAFVFSLICTLTNSWVNNRDASDLRRHRAHYDVIVMRISWGEDTTSFEELEKCSEIPRWCHCNQEMDTLSSYIVLQLITIWTRCLAVWNEK